MNAVHPIETPTSLQAAESLQDILAELIDLSLQLKEAHWNVVGPRFRSVHLELDEILLVVRDGYDEIAERIRALGHAASGGVAVIEQRSKLTPFPEGTVKDMEVVALISERLAQVCEGTRVHIPILGELDPISEDMVIGLTGNLEKAKWMMTAQFEEGSR
ncbi:MAG: DNA starvation/stationary phase protection protein [Pseudomonadota bacterium]